MVKTSAIEMASEEVVVDAMSNSPTDFWNLEKEKRTVMRLKVRTPKEPLKNDKVRFFKPSSRIWRRLSTQNITMLRKP